MKFPRYLLLATNYFRRAVRAFTPYALGIIVIGLTIAGLMGKFAQKTEAAWYSDSWNFRKTLTISGSQVSGSSDLTNFPVLVSLTDSNLSSKAQSDGDDILFTDSNQNKLDHEIESYTSGTGALIAWVKVPTLFTNTDTIIYMYYGNPTASSQQNKTGVWTNSFQGVWHLGESSGSRTDSSPNQNTLTDNNTVTSGTGQIGTAASFTNANSEYLSITNSVQVGLGLVQTDFTVSGWINVNTNQSAWNGGIIAKHSQSEASGYSFYESWGGSGNTYFNNIGIKDGATAGDHGSNSTVATNSWHYFAATFTNSSNDVVVCYDGTCDAAETSLANFVASTTADVWVGRSDYGGTNHYLDGLLDEVRAATVVRSNDWVTTEYNNQNAPGTFLSAGSEEAGPAPISYWNFDEAYGSTANDGSLQNNDLTITGSWKTEDLCVSGKCIQFNGSSHNAVKTYESDFELDVSSGSFTVSFWMRRPVSVSGTDTMVSRVSSGGYRIAASSGSFCFAIDDDSGSFDPDDSACTTSEYADSTWHQVTAVKNGTTSITLYVDGNQVAQDASLLGTGSLSGSSPTFNVGYDGSTNYFDGFLDEVKVYNTAKTASQIKAEYSSRSASGEGSSTTAGTNTIPWMSNGLVGYWRMDETGQNDCDGTSDTCDVSGNVNHGTWTNGATVTGGGKFGRSVWFDGTTDYVSVTDSTSLSVTTQVSLGLWINSSTSVASESLLVKNNSYRLVTDANSNPVCQVSDGSSWLTAATSSTALTTSTWYHVGCSYDGKTIQVFVNGVETGRNALASTIGDNANALEFGRDAGGTYTDFGGVLDEARVFNRGLSPREIEQIYSFAPGPVGWWKMDESSWTNNCSTDTVFDSSGNGNNGDACPNSTGPTGGVPGKFGNAGLFDGGDDKVTITRNANLESTNFTISMWLNPASLSNATTIISKRGSVFANMDWQIWHGATEIRMALGESAVDNVFDNQGITISLGSWHHFAVTKNGNDYKMFIDGVLKASDTSAQTWTESENILIGGLYPSDTASSFDGKIDEVKIYTYARTAKQIVEDMNIGHPAPGSPIGSQTIYWKFDEQQGSTSNNAVNPQGAGEWDGTVNGADWRLPDNNCKINGCLTFPTTTDDVSAGDTAFTDSLTAMTVSLWVSPTTLATSKGIVSKSNFGAGSSFAITTGSTSSEIRVFVASSTSSDENFFTTTDFTLTTSTFSHLAMVYEGSLAAADRVKVYKDGRRVSGSVTGTIPTSLVASSTANLTAGESASTSYQALDAHLDEVKIYTAALTPSEVLLDMNAGSSAAFGGVLGVPGGTPHDNEGFGGNPPVGWWKMDENTGTLANDSSGNGNTGTLTSGPTWANGKLGSAVSFDGTNDFVSIADNSALNPASDLTVSAWVNLSTATMLTTYGDILIKLHLSSPWQSYELQYDEATQKFAFVLPNTAGTYFTAYSNDTASINTWYHVAGVFKGNQLTVYVNGVPGPSTTLTGTAQVGNSALAFGDDNGALDAPFPGRIDDVRIYNYARSQAQIAYDYNRGAPAGWWKFDECQGNTAFDSSLKTGPSTVDMSGGKPGNISFGASGNTSAGTCGSGTTTEMWNNGTTGKMNASLDFDGTDDVVTVANDLAIQLSSGLASGFTISSWINADSAGESNVGEIFDKGTNTYCRTDNPSGSNLDIECNLDLTTTDANVNISSAITTGSWSHVVVTYTDDSDDEITVWVNGKNVGSSTNGVDTQHPADGNALLIGGDSAANFDGRIDDFRIYPYEMTAAQIQRLYNEGAAVRFGPSQGSP